MDKKPYLVLVASKKGGVGKTTISLNLAVALAYNNYKVLLVDSDMESASASEQLGIVVEGKGYEDVLRGGVAVGDALFAYEPIDLDIIPGSPSKDSYEPTSDELVRFYTSLMKLKFDFIIVDSPPGIFNGSIAKYFNDVAILTTPDPVSAVGSSSMAAYCEKYRLEHRLIINRMGYSNFDLNRENVEKLFGDVAFQVVPEDKIVAESILKHKPAFMIDRSAYFSLAIEELARAYALKIGEPTKNRESEIERERRPNIFERLARWALKPK